MTRSNWDRKWSKPQSWIYNMDRKFGSPSPKSRMGKWRVLAFARIHPWLGEMGVYCSILSPRMQVEKRQVNNVMKQIVLRIIPSRLRHVAVIAVFLGDGKPKISLKKVNSHCFKLHRSYSISFFVKYRRNILGVNPRGPYLRLEKENFCVVFTYSTESGA